MKFFSGKGDKGITSLFGSPKRRKKNDPCFEALGTIDEVVSFLGICVALAKNEELSAALEQIQNNLFIIQAEIGNAGQSKKNKKRISDKKIRELETVIEKYGKKAGEIKNFIIPGGSTLSAYFDFVRALTRRAERKCVDLNNAMSLNTMAYLNRLSSLLFVLARYVNKKNGVIEKDPKY
ncbi:MAG: cob(I)yrinic acid a,c-diamide adenosyltransferase [bacterium]|nr:cob(I)yrinic acid a,c-diamide adenosyltransferase [bacterium]